MSNRIYTHYFDNGGIASIDLECIAVIAKLPNSDLALIYVKDIAETRYIQDMPFYGIHAEWVKYVNSKGLDND